MEVPMFVSVVKLIYPEWIMSGHFDGNLTACNITTGEILPFKGHHADVLSVDVNQNLNMVVSGSADLTTKIWNLTSGKVVKTLGEFSHWVVHLVLHDASQHCLERFQGKNILITMTKDFLTMFSWSDLSELSNTWSYQIPLNPTDCFVWKKVFFTPGMQLFGEKIAFVRQVAMFDTHTVGDADLIIADTNTGEKIIHYLN